ncbi:MAG TPA: alpha/beta fold hydrolase [Phaeodactylibacter sp.]|nr:alpha/beta fold hydrolase [Phaeodactylibacter sp.]
MKTAHFSYKERRLSYRFSENEGPLLVFIHGFCEDSRMWEEFIRPFQRDYRILLPELPGFGASEVISPLSIAEMAEALQLCLEDFGADSYALIGHSMGGYVALAFARQALAAQRQSKLKGLALFHSHPYADSEEKRENRRKSIAFIEENGSERFVAQLIPKLFHKRVPQAEQKLIQYARTHLPKGIQTALAAMAERPDNSRVLTQLDIPVAFIVGGKDTAVPLELSMKQCLLPKIAYIEYLREVGHMGMFEAPEKCQDFLLNYLEQVHK